MLAIESTEINVLLFRLTMSSRTLRGNKISGNSDPTENNSGLVQKLGKNGTRGLLTFKPYQRFWSKFEPRSKDRPGASEMGKSDSLKIDVRKQTKVKA